MFASITRYSFGLCLLAMICSGCQQEYGARKRDVKLDSVPPGLTAYIVPNNVWLNNGGAKMLSGPDAATKLEKYRVKEGTTPTTVELMPYETVFVVKTGDKYEYRTFTPSKADETVTIVVPGSETLAKPPPAPH